MTPRGGHSLGGACLGMWASVCVRVVKLKGGWRIDDLDLMRRYLTKKPDR